MSSFDEVLERVEALGKAQGQMLAAQHRDGIIPPAEKIVLDALRALQAIPEGDRLYADELSGEISRVFIESAWGIRNSNRRAVAVLRVAGEQ